MSRIHVDGSYECWIYVKCLVPFTFAGSIVFYFFADINPFFLRPEKYNIIEHNCNNFTNDVSQFLTGNTIPSYITGLPRELLDT